MVTLINKSSNCKDIMQPLQRDAIRKYIWELDIADVLKIDVFSKLSSTNDYLSQKYFKSRQEKNAYHICVAEEQTQGRGRFGHQWWSPAGVNLYLSIFCPHADWREEYEALNLRCLLAVAKLLERQGVTNIQLKWPNDICRDNNKLGGILIERKSQQLIIGIGLNVAMSTAEASRIERNVIKPWVDLLSLCPNWAMNRNELAANLFKEVRETLLSIENNSLDSLVTSWSKYDAMLGKKVYFTYQDKSCRGTVHGIDEKGLVKIKVHGKVLHLHSAHVCDIKL